MAGQNVSLTIMGKVLGHKTARRRRSMPAWRWTRSGPRWKSATAAMLQAGHVKLIEEEGRSNGTQE